MNGKTILAALALMAASPACAQEVYVEQNGDYTDSVFYSKSKHKVVTNTFWNNWFVSVGGGAQMYFGDHDKQVDFADRLSGALDVAVGKWFSPQIGVRLMYSGLQVKGATKWPDSGYDVAHGTGVDVPGKGKGTGHNLQKQKYNMWNVHADVMFNLSNILFGYNEKRIYNCNPYLGVGVMSATSEPKNADVSGHVGIMNSFRLSSAFDINLDLRGTFVNDDFDGEVGGRGGEGMFTATIGLTYKFPQRGWNRSKTIVRYNNAAVNALRARLDDMSAENNRLKNALAQSEKEKAEASARKIAAASFVTFKVGKVELSNEARVNLGMLAEIIKSGGKSTTYTITGYADEGTGSQETNERLSKERAEAVYDCLVNEFGVDQQQLEVDYKGGVENMFYDDPRMSRAVITKSK